MNKALLLVIICVIVPGCAPYESKCVNGVLYYRVRLNAPFTMVDADPAHAGITPTPCVPR